MIKTKKTKLKPNNVYDKFEEDVKKTKNAGKTFTALVFGKLAIDEVKKYFLK